MASIFSVLAGPISPRDRQFTKVNLEMTTRCNMRCPDCATATNNSGKRPALDHPWGYFVNAASYLSGIDSVVVMGGEATLHRQFAEFAPKLRELFQCRELILWTNGFRVREHAGMIGNTFDAVYATLYDERTAPWNPHPNTEEVEFIKQHFPYSIMDEPHTALAKRGNGNLCERGVNGPITWADGKLYPCCVAVGVPGGVGMEPTDNWREKLLNVPMPCYACCFSPS